MTVQPAPPFTFLLCDIPVPDWNLPILHGAANDGQSASRPDNSRS